MKHVKDFDLSTYIGDTLYMASLRDGKIEFYRFIIRTAILEMGDTGWEADSLIDGHISFKRFLMSRDINISFVTTSGRRITIDDACFTREDAVAKLKADVDRIFKTSPLDHCPVRAARFK